MLLLGNRKQKKSSCFFLYVCTCVCVTSAKHLCDLHINVCVGCVVCSVRCVRASVVVCACELQSVRSVCPMCVTLCVICVRCAMVFVLCVGEACVLLVFCVCNPCSVGCVWCVGCVEAGGCGSLSGRSSMLDGSQYVITTGSQSSASARGPLVIMDCVGVCLCM